jgi:hypothetical protein
VQTTEDLYQAQRWLCEWWETESRMRNAKPDARIFKEVPSYGCTNPRTWPRMVTQNVNNIGEPPERLKHRGTTLLKRKRGIANSCLRRGQGNTCLVKQASHFWNCRYTTSSPHVSRGVRLVNARQSLWVGTVSRQLIVLEMDLRTAEIDTTYNCYCKTP